MAAVTGKNHDETPIVQAWAAAVPKGWQGKRVSLNLSDAAVKVDEVAKENTLPHQEKATTHPARIAQLREKPPLEVTLPTGPMPTEVHVTRGRANAQSRLELLVKDLKLGKTIE